MVARSADQVYALDDNKHTLSKNMALSLAKKRSGAKGHGIFSFEQWSMIENALSFGQAVLGATAVFLFLVSFQVADTYQAAVTMSGTVNFIAAYHYYRLRESWLAAFDVQYKEEVGEFAVVPTGRPFNEAYHYADWLVTVPLLLIELILVMTPEETTFKMATLGVSAWLMVLFGFAGEVRNDPMRRWVCFVLSCIPFTYILYELTVGLGEATERMEGHIQNLIVAARTLTVISWLIYPVVYVIKGLRVSGATAATLQALGFTVADIVAKSGYGVLIWRIAVEQTKVQHKA